jgi:hypothetical protein
MFNDCPGQELIGDAPEARIANSLESFSILDDLRIADTVVDARSFFAHAGDHFPKRLTRTPL